MAKKYLPELMYHDRFAKHLEKANETVCSWPYWKQTVLGSNWLLMKGLSMKDQYADEKEDRTKESGMVCKCGGIVVRRGKLYTCQSCRLSCPIGQGIDTFRQETKLGEMQGRLF